MRLWNLGTLYKVRGLYFTVALMLSAILRYFALPIYAVLYFNDIYLTHNYRADPRVKYYPFICILKHH